EARPFRRVTYRRFDRVEPPLYRADIACHETGPVWLCAGPKDAEAGALVGLSTVAQAGGEARRIRPEWRRLLASWDREVRVLFDADEAGRKGAEKAAQDLSEADCRTKVVHIEELASQTAGLQSVPNGFDLADLVGEMVNLQELATREGLSSTMPAAFCLTDLLAWRLWRRPPQRRPGRR
ncbi:MAG: toprim domain-containing protein, partial [Acidobacteriota bacterium]